MPKKNNLSISKFIELYGTDEQCRHYLKEKRWPNGFVCPKCGSIACCELYNGIFQCYDCHHQTSVTAGTVMHRSHLPLTKWFLAFYLVSQDKRGISALQLCAALDVTYKTAWYLLKRIRSAMGQRDKDYLLSGVIEFDDAFIGSPTVGKKRGRGTEKTKIFVALSLNNSGHPNYLRMQVTKNIKKATVQHFAETTFQENSKIRSDGYRSYIAGLENFDHTHQVYDPQAGMLHWLHTVLSNAKAYIIGTYHGLPQKNLQDYLNEFCYRFCRRNLKGKLLDRLVLAVAVSNPADSKG